ncbi:MAG: zinc-binding dehydrogenase, partial [bacterium]
MKNLVWRLRQYPEGLPTAEHLVYGEEDIPEVKDGEIKLRTRYISMDPANRLWIRKEGSYVPPFPLGCVMPGVALGEVIESRHPRYQIGQIVQGTWGWQQYAVLDGGPLDHQLPVRDGGLLIMPDPPEGAGIIDFFGLYGVHGLTAYAGTVHVARAKEGETVLVSAAAGAIGSLVTQIARNLGCYVIGIAGGEEKCRKVVEEFRADVCIDYKRENVDERLKELAPEGVNVYFENVGGEILEAAINNMARFGRIAF